MGSFEGISIGGRAAMSMRRTTSGLFLSFSRKRTRRRKEREEQAAFSKCCIYTRVYKHVTRTYACITYGLHFSYTHVHVHRVNPTAALSTLPSRFFYPCWRYPFFSFEQFFLIELKNTRIHTHTQTDTCTDTRARTCSPPVAMLLCFVLHVSFVSTRNRVKKERKTKR